MQKYSLTLPVDADVSFREVELADCPRIGETISNPNFPQSPRLKVTGVLHVVDGATVLEVVPIRETAAEAPSLN